MAIDKKQISQYTLYVIAALMITAVMLLSNLPSKKTIGRLWQKYAEVEKRVSAIEAKVEGFGVGHDRDTDTIKDLKDEMIRLRERVMK